VILFSPHSIIKIRTSIANSMDHMLACLHVLYQGRHTIHEGVASREWALIGAIGDNTESGEIPIQYRTEMPQVSQGEIEAIHARILEVD
jgi:hypothetical protein